MPLTVGSRLGHYEVTALIGEGGMGQVYRATDTKLNRPVALKILPEAFASDPDRLARFQREAQVLASLNHPGIAAIHGIEESDGQQALVLELVEGPTLADRIAKGPIPLDEALPIAKQIAEALEAAHEAGVIHRDLKPANIKVRGDGTVKVLDFGLAKALDPTPEGDPSQSPTLTAAATQMGVIMGTAAYMSPEQARGKPVDRRADIWAFGCVLYEMLTGLRAFAGETVSETLAAVMMKDPKWDLLSSDLPVDLSSVIRGCLQKTPRDRMRDIGDVRLILTGAFRTASAGDQGAVAMPPLRIWQRPIPLVLAGLALVAATAMVFWTTMSQTTVERVLRYTVSTEAGESLHVSLFGPDIAISPTGDHIAYLTRRSRFGAGRLIVRPTDALASVPLVSEGEMNTPFFSPDGRSVGFYNDPRGTCTGGPTFATCTPLLQRVATQGGPVSTICELRGVLAGASWGSDDTIVFATVGSPGLWRVAAAGGEPEPLTTPGSDEGVHRWPTVLPGGEAVLFSVTSGNLGEDAEVGVVSLETGTQKVVHRGGIYPQYAPSGHLVYSVAGALWAVRFDDKALETIGEPAPVQEGVLTKGSGLANFSVSASGSLIYTAGGTENDRTLVWVDLEGREEPLPLPPAPYESPRIAPDGRRIAVEVRGDNTDIVVYDLEREIPTRFTFDAAADGHPMWSPDGQRLIFSSDRNGTTQVYSRAAGGTGEAEQLTTGERSHHPDTWSPDGQTLVVSTRFVEGEGGGFVALDAAGQTTDLLMDEFGPSYADVSPDGRWIAYVSFESGNFEVYVRPFPNVSEGKWQVSRDGWVGGPVWGPNSQELFFRDNFTTMRRVRIDADPAFVPGNPEVLFDNPYRGGGGGRARPFDLHPDGTRFLMIKERDANPPIVVVLNWTEELKRLVPTK